MVKVKSLGIPMESDSLIKLEPRPKRNVPPPTSSANSKSSNSVAVQFERTVVSYALPNATCVTVLYRFTV